MSDVNWIDYLNNNFDIDWMFGYVDDFVNVYCKYFYFG